MKKSLIFTSILLLVGVLVACTGTQSLRNSNRSSGQGNANSQGVSANGNPGSTELSLESIVGVGILKLEGNDQAIDAAKAAELLPLFKALKTLSTNNNTAVAEISALNSQIKNTLTADQLTAIQNLKITSSDIRTLMETNGLLTTGSSSGTRTNSSAQGGFGGPPDAAMMAVMSGQSVSRTSSTTKATPNAAAALATARKSAGGYNLTFVDVIIKLLESKITK
jgi:hypothetical protein